MMKLTNKSAEMFIPDSVSATDAVKRTTHMGVGAHQDDLEVMAYDGIYKCFGSDDCWFFGVVLTDGAGSPREGAYAGYTDAQMMKIRRREQKKASVAGEYGALAMLDYTSSELKNSASACKVVDDLKTLMENSRPQVVYIHNPADKHDTHVAGALRTIRALRELPANLRPRHLYGCEVWRSLDWINNGEKIVFNVGGRPNLEAALLGVYDSQISGGNRYDIATAGRRFANATFADTHSVEKTTSAIYAIELKPLIEDDELDPAEFVEEYIDRFARDVSSRIRRLE